MKKLIAIITFLYLSPTMALEKEAVLKLLKQSRCTTCHDIEKDKIGPSYKEVAAKYKGKDAASIIKAQTAADYLFDKVRNGTKKDNKNWTKSKAGKSFGVMTKNPKSKISDEDLKAIIQYILSL